ncbi:Panacea domain-containing protein [Pseudalkalibacillus sp. SCS-8]|uniref:Panacea domain-containing protein n=1 Tax=Pseudalkalibacillus nanhaiensis TaxID=3115291 RepID=UPI0032DAD666
MASAIDVAKYFINLSQPGTNENITNLKLQKLLYYAQGFFMALNDTDEPLFDEEIQAWVHGPVVPEVYREFKGFSYKDININYHDEVLELTQVEIELLDEVWRNFGRYNGKDLERLSHTEPPWIQAREGLAPYDYGDNEINPQEIRAYFAQEYIVER